jgi:hypothetical protein
VEVANRTAARNGFMAAAVAGVTFIGKVLLVIPADAGIPLLF